MTNVASYCVVLAERLGITDSQELEQIATAAMLHDVGKRFIPASILTKPSRLDPTSVTSSNRIPIRGYEELCERADMTEGQLMMVYQHHERIDGNGYPVGILKTKFTRGPKCLAVVDVFDAMTGRRPYRRPATPASRLRFIERKRRNSFRSGDVECWISAMSKA